MWRACGNDDNVALFKFMVHTALYSRARYARTIFARDLDAIRRPGFWIDHRTACHQRPRPFHHVVNFRDLEVHGGVLGLALSPVEHTDANIMASCVNHSNIWKSVGLSWPHQGLNLCGRYGGSGQHFGLGVGNHRRHHTYRGQEGKDTHFSHLISFQIRPVGSSLEGWGCLGTSSSFEDVSSS